MTKEITTEQRREWAAKAAATRHGKHEREIEAIHQKHRDAERALEVCREIRDRADASDGDKLKAVELLLMIKQS